MSIRFDNWSFTLRKNFSLSKTFTLGKGHLGWLMVPDRFRFELRRGCLNGPRIVCGRKDFAGLLNRGNSFFRWTFGKFVRLVSSKHGFLWKL